MALIIEIKVTPSSGRQLCKLDKSGTLKCFLKSPPEQGKANQELVKFLSKSLELAQDQVTILSGHTTRNKRIKIDASLTFIMVLDMLGIERQSNLF
jgi:uncharacterized protein (TIGR00251 family)